MTCIRMSEIPDARCVGGFYLISTWKCFTSTSSLTLLGVYLRQGRLQGSASHYSILQHQHHWTPRSNTIHPTTPPLDDSCIFSHHTCDHHRTGGGASLVLLPIRFANLILAEIKTSFSSLFLLIVSFATEVSPSLVASHPLHNLVYTR